MKGGGQNRVLRRCMCKVHVHVKMQVHGARCKVQSARCKVHVQVQDLTINIIYALRGARGVQVYFHNKVIGPTHPPTHPPTYLPIRATLIWNLVRKYQEIVWNWKP